MTRLISTENVRRFTVDHKKPGPLGESGQAVIEFVLVVPVLLFVLFAIAQFAFVYSHYVQLTDATRVGARVAAVSRATCPGNAEQAVRDSAGGLDDTKLNVSISSCPWSAGGQVEVSATYPWSIDLIGIVVASGTLSSTTKERVE
jgi:Flp pilus assembly protein TadG